MDCGCRMSTLTLLFVFHLSSSGFPSVQREHIHSSSPSSRQPSLRRRLAAEHLHSRVFCDTTNESRIMCAHLFAGRTSPVVPSMRTTRGNVTWTLKHNVCWFTACRGSLTEQMYGICLLSHQKLIMKFRDRWTGILQQLCVHENVCVLLYQ